MFEKVKALIQKTLNKDGLVINPQTDLIGDAGINSLELVELVCAFEEEFNVKIPDRDINKLRVISEVVKYLEERV